MGVWWVCGSSVGTAQLWLAAVRWQPSLDAIHTCCLWRVVQTARCINIVLRLLLLLGRPPKHAVHRKPEVNGKQSPTDRPRRNDVCGLLSIVSSLVRDDAPETEPWAHLGYSGRSRSVWVCVCWSHDAIVNGSKDNSTITRRCRSLASFAM